MVSFIFTGKGREPPLAINQTFLKLAGRQDEKAQYENKILQPTTDFKKSRAADNPKISHTTFQPKHPCNHPRAVISTSGFSK